MYSTYYILLCGEGRATYGVTLPVNVVALWCIVLSLTALLSTAVQDLHLHHIMYRSLEEGGQIDLKWEIAQQTAVVLEPDDESF